MFIGNINLSEKYDDFITMHFLKVSSERPKSGIRTRTNTTRGERERRGATAENIELWIFPIARRASGLHDVMPFGLFRPMSMYISVTIPLPASYFMEYMITQLWTIILRRSIA